MRGGGDKRQKKLGIRECYVVARRQRFELMEMLAKVMNIQDNVFETLERFNTNCRPDAA